MRRLIAVGALLLGTAGLVPVLGGVASALPASPNADCVAVLIISRGPPPPPAGAHLSFLAQQPHDACK